MWNQKCKLFCKQKKKSKQVSFDKGTQRGLHEIINNFNIYSKRNFKTNQKLEKNES